MLHDQQPDTAARAPAMVSRRRLIITGAGMAAAGVAVGAAAAIPLAAAETATGSTPATASADTPAEPIVVHLLDAPTGRFDVYVGTRRVQLDDRAFAARLTTAVTG